MKTCALALLLVAASAPSTCAGGPVGAEQPQGAPVAPAPSPAPPPAPNEATACSGTAVREGDDIVAIVNGGERGQAFCIGPGTFSIGTASLVPQTGMRITGAPVRRGESGAIDAPTRIVGTSTRGVVYFATEARDVVIENLDISGATGVKDEADAATKQHGRGINGNTGNAVNLTVRACAIHDNANTGIGGCGPGLVVTGCELHRNGSDSYLGCCAGGVKSANPLTVQDSYVHHNTGVGIWQDICGTDFVVERNRAVVNSEAGIRYEHQRDCLGSAHILHNVVQGNNPSCSRAHGGIEINSAPGAEVAFNVLGGNGHAGIIVYGARGPVTGTRIHDNEMNDDVIAGCDRPGVSCD